MDALNRRLLVRAFPSMFWTWTGAVVGSGGDAVRVGDIATLASGSISRPYIQPIPTGKVHVAMGISSNDQHYAGSTCDLTLVTQQGATAPVTTVWTITGQGTGVLTTGALATAPAARTLREVRVACTAGASVTIDWLSVQNTSDVVPPSSEASMTWDDVGLPGGGLSTRVVRAEDHLALWAGSDVGGVARRMNLAVTYPWTAVSGEPASGALVSQPDLAVWDVLPSTWGEVYLLTGRAYGTGVQGGLFSSFDYGNSWQSLVTSDPTVDANDATEVTIAAYGRFSACVDSDGDRGTAEWAGGALLIEEPDSEGVYVANHDAEDVGLAYWDGVEACLLADIDLPAEPIGAMARVESDAAGVAALVVGFRGGTDGLYLCELPQVDTDADGQVDTVTFDCTDTSGITCAPIAGYTGVDVRDLEVDPNGYTVYVADGGEDPALATCEDGVGGVWAFDLLDDGLGGLQAPTLTEISSGMTLSASLEVTGVSMDPDGDFLFAFVPVTPGGGYESDRIYRIPYADIGTAAWVAINQDAADEPTRDAHLDLSGAWLEASAPAKPRVSSVPYPNGTQATYAPGQAIDGVWFADETTADLCGGQAWSAAMVTTFNMWRVDGLDAGCDGSAWDPEADTTWTFWPEPQSFEGRVWQTTAVNDVAWDSCGNVWMAMGDLGLGELPFGASAAQVDCLWDAFDSGGSRVVATRDGTVWVAMYDQGDGIPNNIGVFRTLDEGVSWEYEGAGIPTASDYAYEQAGGAYWDYLSCVDADLTHLAPAFGEVAGIDDGNAFRTDLAAAETDQAVPSWGQPFGLDALDADTAVVGFRGYSYEDAAEVVQTQTGRLAYTVDGGLTWESVLFAGGVNGCDEQAFFSGLNAVALLQPDVRSYNGGPDAWRLEMFVSSNTGNTYDYHNCALARVVVEPGAVPTWDWYPLDRDSTETICAIDGRNLSGVSTSPWGEHAFIWGTYLYQKWNGQRKGGVCTVDIDDPSLRDTVVGPDDWRLSIGDVAPHPWVSDLIGVAPLITASTWEQCHQDGDGDCPDAPRVILAENGSSGWTLSQVQTMPPSLTGYALAWTDLVDPALIYGTAGGGTWRGELSWE